MQPNHRVKTQSGFTFAELAFGLLVFVIGAVVLINHLSVNYSSTRAQSERVFAFTKAQALLAEVQAYVDRGEAAAAIDLDALDDGTTNKSTLTISREGGTLVVPDHPLSGNSQRDGLWIWSRRISVQRFAGINNRNLRYVTVRVYKRDLANVEHQLAYVSSVVTSVGSSFPTTQVFDVYYLAIENIPGWWVYMDAIKPFVESTVQDLESRNPGLDIRTHWITKASYGRNEGYRPLINETISSTADQTRVYWYPGLMPTGSASTNYYVPGLMRARMWYDAAQQHGYNVDTNPYPYALADWFNHGMRYPQEQAFHKQRVDAATARRIAIEDARRLGGTVPAEMDDTSEEPTLRLLLEDMCTNPNKYRRAMIVNLHGELLPMPSLRNFSDAAKDPESLPNVRVVTHAEELRTKRDPAGSGIDDVYLRVYAYSALPGIVPAAGEYMPTTRPIAVKIMNVDLTSGGSLIAGATVELLNGGVMVGGSRQAYTAFASAAPTASGSEPAAPAMYYKAIFVPPAAGKEGFTLLKLYHTPLIAPWVRDTPTSSNYRGLYNSTRARLYGLEYQPSCCEAGADFSRNLATIGPSGGDGPRNTARWRIKIPASVFSGARFVDLSNNYSNPAADVTLKVQTLIWDDGQSNATNLAYGPSYASGVYPTPSKQDNFSETYTWWADSATDVPFSERSQFQGDPRHNPYRDNLASTTVPAPDFLNGTNWFHDTLVNGGVSSAADYPALDATVLRNNWMGSLRQDLPRCFQMLRTGLVNTGSVYTTLTGFSYYYVGFGAEIGYDSANGYPSSIPVNLRPFGSPGSTGFTNNITGRRKYVRSASNLVGASYWWGQPWLGELYPDAEFTAQWQPNGNLSAGTAAGQFWQVDDNTAYASGPFLAYGTSMTSARQITAAEGSTSLFNIGSSASTFHHQFTDGQTGTLVGSGLELASNYNFPMPMVAGISRPFRLNTSGAGGTGPEWSLNPYAAERGSASILRTYYDHQSGSTGSGLVQLFNTGSTASCFVIVNGLDRTVESGSAFISKYAMLSMVQSFLEGGTTSLAAAHRIKQPPRVQIIAPTDITELANPTSIAIQVQIDWLRWDGLKYTSSTSSTFAEAESEIEYVVCYSADAGTVWRQFEDNSIATPGKKPTNSTYVHADTATGNETFNWSVPAASFPEGSYLLRVEAYRQNQSLHYCQHQAKIYINR